MTHTITFFADGTARALHSETIALHQLGILTIRRASSVEFNPTSQKWEVRLAIPNADFIAEVSYTHLSRQACLDWEREFFEGTGACLLDDMPRSVAIEDSILT